MNKCDDCGQVAEGGSLTGQDEKTKKTKTLCWPCFEKDYELVPGQKSNVFRRKGSR